MDSPPTQEKNPGHQANLCQEARVGQAESHCSRFASANFDFVVGFLPHSWQEIGIWRGEDVLDLFENSRVKQVTW